MVGRGYSPGVLSPDDAHKELARGKHPRADTHKAQNAHTCRGRDDEHAPNNITLHQHVRNVDGEHI